jgi:predicted RNA binding protein YcfA (HicA-like mRNA interferase family)
MPRLGPVKRQDLIRYLKHLGFEGPYSGGKHQFMIKGGLTLAVPNPHRGDIGIGLLTRILRQGGIDKDEWERLG